MKYLSWQLVRHVAKYVNISKPLTAVYLMKKTRDEEVRLGFGDKGKSAHVVLGRRPCVRGRAMDFAIFRWDCLESSGIPNGWLK